MRLLLRLFICHQFQTRNDYCTPGAHDSDGILYNVVETISRAYEEELRVKRQADQLLHLILNRSKRRLSSMSILEKLLDSHKTSLNKMLFLTR